MSNNKKSHVSRIGSPADLESALETIFGSGPGTLKKLEPFREAAKLALDKTPLGKISGRHVPDSRAEHSPHPEQTKADFADHIRSVLVNLSLSLCTGYEDGHYIASFPPFTGPGTGVEAAETIASCLREQGINAKVDFGSNEEQLAHPERYDHTAQFRVEDADMNSALKAFIGAKTRLIEARKQVDARPSPATPD